MAQAKVGETAQANEAFSRDEYDTVSHVLLQHDVSRAVLVFRCEDGSQSHIIFLAEEVGSHAEFPAETEKNAIVEDLLTSALEAVRTGIAHTKYRGRSTPEQ